MKKGLITRKLFGLVKPKAIEKSPFLRAAQDIATQIDADMETSEMSGLWGTRKYKRATDPESVIYDLIQIRDTVDNMTRVVGVPRDTLIGLAGTMPEGTSGLSGYLGGLGKKPYIQLSRHIYDETPDDLVLDVYCGVALHEAAHLLFSRDLFSYLRLNPDISKRRRVFLNLLEDERIERKIFEQFPGFGSYILTTKRVVLEKNGYYKALDNWENMADIEKGMFLAMTYLRVPFLLKDSMTTWVSRNGIHVFKRLNEIMTIFPTAFSHVRDKAVELDYLLKELEEKETSSPSDYKEKSDEASDYMDDESDSGGGGSDSAGDEKPEDGGSGSGDPHEEKPEDESDDSDSGDDEDEEVKEEETKEKEADKKSKFDEMDRRRAEARELRDIKEELEIREELDKLRKREDEKLKDVPAKDVLEKGKFSLDAAEKMFTDEKVESLDSDEQIEVEKIEGERHEDHGKWGDSCGPDRRIKVVHPQADMYIKKYQAYHDAVRNDVSAMRKVFQFRLAEKRVDLRERRIGKIDRTKLSKALISDRIFHLRQDKSAHGMALCVVLDESGSMGGTAAVPSSDVTVRECPATTTLKIAVMIAEAVKPVKGIELEVYSYSSFGDYSQDCLVKYLYGKNNPTLASIAGYEYGYQNYDHVALRTCGKLFEKNTRNKNRMMVVVSDGSPAGHDYGGPSAIEATRREVEELSKRMFVMQVAIRSFESEKMFKNYVKFLDQKQLITDMKKLIVGMVRKVTMSK
jgi:hypothetical protein